MKHAIILASGGLDSYVLAHFLKKEKNRITILFINYNQKCLKNELKAVKKLSKEIYAKLEIVDLKWLGKISTSLINHNKKRNTEILNWYVPFRNSVFLNLALALAESKLINKKEKNEIYIGIKYEGNLRFKDTTSAFLKKMNEVAKFSEKDNFKIKAPFLNLDKEDVINFAKKMNLNLEKTYSCYLGKPKHCGKCGGCLARKKGFKFSNVKDSTKYII